jgi:hypothetical protein
MAGSLAVAYLVSLAVLAAMVALGRGALPEPDGFTTFFCMSLIGVLMFPVSILFFRGARLSSGSLRKILAYGLSAAAAFMGLGSSIAVILVLVGAAKPG